MAIDRSEFLRISAWGFAASLLPIHQIKALSMLGSPSGVEENTLWAASDAAMAKEHFFKKEYTKAELLYDSLIKAAPSDIQLYDGLQNVYGAQGKWRQCVELYNKGLTLNPEKIEFYDRTARALMRLELGYPVDADQYKSEVNSDSLLRDAEFLFSKAIIMNRSASFLQDGHKKVIHKIETNAVNKNYRTDKTEKENRKKRRNKHRQRYTLLNNDQLLQRLNTIETKKRNPLYFKNEVNTREKNIRKEVKRIYVVLANRYAKEENHAEALAYASKVYQTDTSDTRITKLIKRLHIKSRNYTELVNFQEQHDSRMRTVYSALGLMNALLLKYENETQSPELLVQSIAIGEDLMTNWGLVDSLAVNVMSKLCHAYILYGKYSVAQDLLKQAITTMPVQSEGIINTLVYNYAKAHLENRQYNEAKEILLMGLKDYQFIDTNSFGEVQSLAARKVENRFTLNLQLFYLLHEVYNRQGDEYMQQDILNHILTKDPQNRFALKRQ